MRSCAAEFDDRERVRLTVTGVVQGVGFRPFIWRLASAMRLTGFVRNVATGVEIEIEGSRSRIRDFPERMRHELPPVANIETIESLELPLRKEREFRAMPSARGRTATMIGRISRCAPSAGAKFWIRAIAAIVIHSPTALPAARASPS